MQYCFTPWGLSFMRNSDLGDGRNKMPKSDALYQKEHWFAIKLKNQIYKRLPRVKEKVCGTRNQYMKEYYKKHCDKFLKRSREWVENNRKKSRFYKKKYKEKLKKIKLKKEKALFRSIDEILKEFLVFIKDRFKPSTSYQYTLNITRFRAYLLDKYKIESIDLFSKEIIIDYINYVNSEEVNWRRYKLNQSEKAARLYPLRVLLRYLYRKGYIKKNLDRFVIVQRRTQKAPKRALTPEEMERLLSVPDQDTTLGIRQKAMMEVMYSALRINELLSLKVKDIDLDTNKIDILVAKGEKDRVVPMTSECLYWIKRWLNRRDEFVKNNDDPEYLFISRNGKKIPRRCFAIKLSQYAKKAGIDIDITPHDLRKATATHLAQNGAPIRMIQVLLGHATLAVTTKYLRIPDEKIKEEHKRTHPSNRRKLYYGSTQR